MDGTQISTIQNVLNLNSRTPRGSEMIIQLDQSQTVDAISKESNHPKEEHRAVLIVVVLDV